MQLETPYLAVDLEVLKQNLAKMAKHASSRGIALRPHAKTHKTPKLAKLQIKSGAVGITVATIGEAEVFAKAGIRDIFIAYPIFATQQKLRRLRKLMRMTKLRIGIDSIEGAKSLKNLRGLKVMVEIDSGHHRSGCDPAVAGAIALEASGFGLDPIGVFTFPGHSYSPGAMAKAVSDESSALKAAVKSMKKVGIEPKVISSGSTPTAMITGKSKGASIVNELRPGVYIFNDAQQWELGTCSPQDIALTAVATVVSVSGSKIIVDSGSKILGADRPSWASGYGRLIDYPNARISALSEHHATVIFPDPKKGSPKLAANGNIPRLGERVRVVPNHVCSAVNLVDWLYVLAPNGKTRRYRIKARGKNS